MSRYNRNKGFYGRPYILNEEERKAPLQVMDDFFTDIHLHESREYLAEWLECALTTDNSQFSEANQRSAIVNFAEKLEELIEAAYILIQKKKMP